MTRQNPYLRNSVLILSLGGALLAATGCRDAQAPGPDLRTLANLIVSNPRGASPVHGVPASSWSNVNLVYSSLPPGSVPDGRSIVIRNNRTGDSVTAFLTAGGFDPVPLVADVGDTLDIQIVRNTPEQPLTFIALVPLRRPPVIVRTDPPPGKRDVPLNARIILVFSEPIDPATLTDGSVTLVSNGSVVDGTLTFEDPANLIVSFTPFGALASDRGYSLIVSQEIEDLGGDQLAAAVTVPFVTASTAPAGATGIYVASASGTGAKWLVQGDWPAWSPDGKQIAFERAGQIYTVNVDGSGTRLLTVGTQPSWSPDGGRIAFATPTGLAAIRTDGTFRVGLVRWNFDPSIINPLGLGKPAWSPDGARIVFEHYGNDDLPGQIYVMNSHGGSPQRVTAPYGVQYAESDPSWSADGSRILFWSFGHGVAFADPFLVTVSSVYMNFPFSAYGTRPQQSSSGGSILFTGREPVTALYIMSPTGTGLRKLIDNAYNGAFSPDGSRIAFVRGTP